MSGEESDGDQTPPIYIRVLQVLTPDPIRRSFAIKFGLVLLVMAMSIGGIGYVATQAIAAETEANVENDFRSVALQESDIIEEWLERNRLSVRLVSERDIWSSNNAEEVRLALQTESAGLSSDVQQMHLLEPGEDGSYEVVGSTSLDTGTELSGTERSWVNEGDQLEVWDGLAGDDVYMQDTYGVGGQRFVGFVSPTPSQPDRLLVVEVSVLEISESLQGSQGGEERVTGGFTQVVDGTSFQVMIDGQTDANVSDVLSAYTNSQAASEPVRLANEIRESGADQQAGVITDMAANPDVINEPYTVGYAPIGGSDWAVVTHAPRSQVFGFVQTVQNFGLLATIAAVLLIGIVGTTLGYSTSRSIDRLTRKTQAMEEGDLDVTLYTHRVDNIGRLYNGFAEMRDALKEQIQEAERSAKEAEVARAEAEEMATYLQEKAEEYSEVMQKCGAGDLTQRMAKDGEEESMDRIADEFNEMIEELEKTTGQLKSYVDEVEQAGAEVEQSANTVREAGEQVADSISRISDSAYDQKERLQNISETMDSVASRLEDYADEHPEVDFGDALDEIRTVAADLEETAELSEETMAESENVAGAAEEQAAELNEVGERAHDLQRYAQPLRDILERFETEAEHEFVFSVGPTGGTATPSVSTAGDEDEDESEAADEE